MEKIRQRIEAAGAWNVLSEIELKAFWKYGIETVRDEGLRATVIGFLEEVVPIQFFTEPASPSGKHHPPWQNKSHGTLRSITECCVLAPAMARYIPRLLNADRQLLTGAIDVVLAATVISDTFKIDGGGKKTGAGHGRIAAGEWRRYAAPRGVVYPFIIDKIADACLWHYGAYAPEWRKDVVLSPEAELVHLLDAFTAQKALAVIYSGKGVIE